MGMIVDYVCMNCFFIGTTADRGIRCCEKPELMSVKGYHTVRRTMARKGRFFEVNPNIQKYFSIALEESKYKGDDDEERRSGSLENDAIPVRDDDTVEGGQSDKDSQQLDNADGGEDNTIT